VAEGRSGSPLTRNEMTTTVDPFEIVRDWWGNRPVTSEAKRYGIDPSTKDGAFECVILGILFAISDTGPEIGGTLNAMRTQGMTSITTLASLSNNPQIRKDLVDIWSTNYFGGRLPDKIDHMETAAAGISHHLQGDVRSLYEHCNGNGEEMIRWLKSTGLGIKRFWLLREMRIGGVWNIAGSYCCVPDIQVRTSLDRWYKKEEKKSLRSKLECSRIVWNYFGELYDYPVLKYARDFKCNQSERQCAQCDIAQCKARSPAPIGPLMDDD